ncbi:alpha/beta fold hydrolase [Christiangramia forsetii]|uniref:Alpha/beta fold hydrolase n=2 Tax=Christiangramia forsetii TaxID=411153 RepID=A0M339_CHRFK|nr:alpha/beta hydrolase [Christiangramia forsetii]GGG26838.1 hydrolase [Christiangramia forsetii]CAL67034.1 alpha/beta fold hydrolase [Christiangramia forsetii KT0803]
MNEEIKDIISTHERSGKYLEVNGIKTFALDRGSGEAVFCIHGVPTSSYLYRKVIDSLAAKGFRGVSVDLPGLGLADRPEDFNYDFNNFADFLAECLKELNIDKFHLVVHDIGAPIGFALAAKNLEKVHSLTILNSMIDIQNFDKPLVMRPFEKKLLGEIELKTITHTTWPIMFSQMGVNDTSKIPSAEIKAYVDLLKRKDDGKAFLKIMRNFNQTEKFQAQILKALKNVDYPIQAIWGKDDPALTYDHYKEELEKYTDSQETHLLSSRHFLQEEVYEEIAEKIATFARKA